MTIARRLPDLLRDARALRKVCGWGVAFRWLTQVVLNASAIFRQRNLQAADRAMGEGPFRCKLGGAEALLLGANVMGGIREIWCRNVYLGGGIEIHDGDVVVDLGANIGNFSMLALGHGPNVRVIAVEPNPELNAQMEAQLRLNGWTNRCTILSGFVGMPIAKMRPGSPVGDGAGRCVSFEQVQDLARQGIDLLKCDVEGAEFSILRRGVGWIESARQIAMEVHFDFGSWGAVEADLIEAGFEVALARRAPQDAIYIARKKA